MKIKRFMTAVGMGLLLTLTGCAEWRDFPGANQHNGGLVFSADGSLLAPKAGPNPKVWDTKTRKILWETDPGGKGGRIDSVAFSPVGQMLAMGDIKGSIKLRGAKTGTLFWAGKHSGRVYALAFSPDGKFLASGVGHCGTADKPIKLWDAKTGKLIQTFDGASDSVYFVAFSPDGKTLVSGGGDNTTIKLWDVKTGSLLRVLTLSGRHEIAFSPDGKTLAFSGDGTIIKLWDMKTWALRRTLTGHSEPVLSVAFSPDGKLLASGSRDASVRLWEVETGKSIREIMRVAPGFKLSGGHSYAVRGVAFSPDGKVLASASVDPVVKLWNVETAGEWRWKK